MPLEPSVPPRGATDPRAARVVVVGAGLAGTQTAAALRAHGHTGTLTVVGDEDLPPYDRPPLSKELMSRTEPAWLSAELGADLTALADEVLLGDAARVLLPSSDGARVVTASGRTLDADVVVLACGSRPVRPAGWDGAVVLHTADDAAALRSRLRPGVRLVCVGAGWIGAEVAGAAARAGCDVTVVEAAGVPLHRQLGTVVGEHLGAWYASAGVRLLTSATVTGVTSRAVHATDASGRHHELAADVVLVAVGARPATGWLDGAVRTDARGAVVVDASGRADLPGAPPGSVRAVGDCAVRADGAWGTVPGGHWSAALLDPDAVARSVLGLDAPARPAPYVFSTQLGHDLALLGLPDVASDDVVLRGDPGTPGTGWGALYVDRTGRVTGILAVDSPRDVGGARRLLAHGPVELDVGRAADPTVALRSTVRVDAG
ncbi:NAD(P)/FAD-dependent oxidoreductase [Sanguibacter suaedae]|uniref:FAD-dependent oxidoreductase n=1 Tax=Sanguibacter suaedae TaxID=2795737 RepID=A0A934IA68_9MICO|nr:FAD-dependent oxidoreductase [Sanguibacter suaedae]MBI9114156.1 FAD-dependent oxidoreductase [Sanguibacter suaedae]